MQHRAVDVLFGILKCPAVVACIAGTAWAIELPAEIGTDLVAEEFRTREAAQGRLLEWAQELGDPATDEIYRQSREAADPEIRDRCLAVLRELVNSQYYKDGKGYVGINMQDEIANIPGDPKPRAVIRVMHVMPDTAAQIAGIQVNDLIAGLGTEVWHLGLASKAFGDKIKEMKPDTKVKLKVLRDGKLMDIEVKLGKRPIYADRLPFDETPMSLEAAEREAREAYFREWMDKRKSRK